MKNEECRMKNEFYWQFPLIALNLSIECSESFHRIDWRFPLILLKHRALNVFITNLRHRNAEPSPSR